MLPGTSADDRCIMCEIWLGVTYITLKMREFSHTLGKTVMYWNEEVDKNKGENVPDRTRTCGLTLRRRALYPLSYGDYIMDDTICVNVSQAKNNDAPHNYCFSHRLSKRATARVALQNHSRFTIIVAPESYHFRAASRGRASSGARRNTSDHTASLLHRLLVRLITIPRPMFLLVSLSCLVTRYSNISIRSHLSPTHPTRIHLPHIST